MPTELNEIELPEYEACMPNRDGFREIHEEEKDIPCMDSYPPTGSIKTPTLTPIVTPPPAAPHSKCIKGQVFIPDNTAQDDIKIQVYLENTKEKIYTTYVDINKGESSKEFTLYTLDASSDTNLH